MSYTQNRKRTVSAKRMPSSVLLLSLLCTISCAYGDTDKASAPADNNAIYIIAALIIALLLVTLWNCALHKMIKTKTVKLEESSARYKTIFDSANDAIFLMDKGYFVECNKKTLEMFDCNESDILGFLPSKFSPEYQPDGQLSADKAMEKINNSLNGIPQQFQWKHITLNGSLFDADVSLNRIDLPSGPHLQAIVRDISQRKNMEMMMLQTEKMSCIAGLAAGMAHEINNPLAVITQSIQTIQRRLESSKEKNVKKAAEFDIDLDKLERFFAEYKITKFHTATRAAVERAAKIVKNMLMFTRTPEDNLQPTDLSMLIDNTIELGAADYDLKKKYDFKFAEIEKIYDNDLAEINCCPTELEQVFLNLFKNALQAMETISEPGFKPKFTIRISNHDDFVHILFSDNGPGIPADIRPKIFDPFFTTKPIGQGTGLGLSVTHAIITQNHGGTIELISPPETESGTTFLITLPRYTP